MRGHVTKKHLNGDEIDENGAFVASAFPVAMLERVGQVVFSRPEVVVEHVLTSDVKFVRYLLRFRISEKTPKRFSAKVSILSFPRVKIFGQKR